MYILIMIFVKNNHNNLNVHTCNYKEALKLHVSTLRVVLALKFKK